MRVFIPIFFLITFSSSLVGQLELDPNLPPPNPECDESKSIISEWKADKEAFSYQSLGKSVNRLWCIGSPSFFFKSQDGNQEENSCYRTCDGVVTIISKFIVPNNLFLENPIIPNTLITARNPNNNVISNFGLNDIGFQSFPENYEIEDAKGCDATQFKYGYAPIQFEFENCGFQNIEICFLFFSENQGRLDITDVIPPCLLPEPPILNGNCLSFEIEVCCDEYYDDQLKPRSIKNKEPEIAFYPNPVTEILNISNSNNISECTIISPEGKLVKRVKDINTKEFSLSLHDLKSGIYILTYEVNGITKSKKFLKN